MQKQPFTANFTVNAENQAEAARIFTALTKMVKVAEVNDLEAIANKVEKNPSLIKKALKFI